MKKTTGGIRVSEVEFARIENKHIEEPVEIVDSLEELVDTPLGFSPAGINFMDRFVKDEDLASIRLLPEDLTQLAAGIARLRGPVTGRQVPRDFTAIIETLIRPGGNIATVNELVLPDEQSNNVYQIIRSISQRCERATATGVTIENLIQLGNPEYQPKITREVAHELGGAASLAIIATPQLEYHTQGVQKTLLDYDPDQPLEWRVDALCAQTDPEAFFPEKGGSTRSAKKICEDCEVRNICLEYALQNDERFGIWGGLSERERRKLKKVNAA